MPCIDRKAIEKARRYINSISWKCGMEEEVRSLPIEINDEVTINGNRYLAMDLLTPTDEGLRLVSWSQVDEGAQRATDYIDVWQLSRDWTKKEEV